VQLLDSFTQNSVVTRRLVKSTRASDAAQRRFRLTTEKKTGFTAQTAKLYK